MAETIRILIADDHTIFRSGLRLLLASEPGFEVVGEAEDGDQVIALAHELLPDVVLMDIGMPGTNGLEATKRIKELIPAVNVLVLTMHRSEEYFFQMLEAGASGYVLKGAETSDLIQSVRTVARGEVFLYPSLAARLVEEYLRERSETSSPSSKLTPRESQILQLIADGYTNKEIAEMLVISPSTVHSHLTNLMQKLEFTKRHELVQYARQHGLIPDA
jgi:two-component system response regulator NreC